VKELLIVEHVPFNELWEETVKPSNRGHLVLSYCSLLKELSLLKEWNFKQYISYTYKTLITRVRVWYGV